MFVELIGHIWHVRCTRLLYILYLWYQLFHTFCICGLSCSCITCPLKQLFNTLYACCSRFSIQDSSYYVHSMSVFTIVLYFLYLWFQLFHKIYATITSLHILQVSGTSSSYCICLSHKLFNIYVCSSSCTIQYMSIAQLCIHYLYIWYQLHIY